MSLFVRIIDYIHEPEKTRIETNLSREQVQAVLMSYVQEHKDDRIDQHVPNKRDEYRISFALVMEESVIKTKTVESDAGNYTFTLETVKSVLKNFDLIAMQII